VDCRLVLVGAPATDDPEGQAIYESLLSQQDDDVHILFIEDSLLVNALQRRAAVVLQKSIREGFGLTVAEAMWKGTPVIGGNVGGIRYQIRDGVNGFLVSNIPEAAGRIVRLLKDDGLRGRLGQQAMETVRRKFLLVRLLEQYVDLLNSFEIRFNVRENREIERRMLAPEPEPQMQGSI
jgi:trehalose synthase